MAVTEGIQMTFKDMVRWIESQGWLFVRVNGSHYIFRHPLGVRTIGICHNAKNRNFGPPVIKTLGREMDASIAEGTQLRLKRG